MERMHNENETKEIFENVYGSGDKAEAACYIEFLKKNGIDIGIDAAQYEFFKKAFA